MVPVGVYMVFYNNNCKSLKFNVSHSNIKYYCDVNRHFISWRSDNDDDKSIFNYFNRKTSKTFV